MSEAFDRLIDYFNSGDNYDKLIWLLIALIITTVFNFIVSLQKRFTKYVWNGMRKFYKLVIDKMNKLKNHIIYQLKYKQTIRKIEKGEMDIPEYFLNGKTQEKNPELNKIYRMIDEGLLEEPIELKLARHLEENLKDFDKLFSSKNLTIQKTIDIPDYIKNFKRDN